MKKELVLAFACVFACGGTMLAQKTENAGINVLSQKQYEVLVFENTQSPLVFPKTSNTGNDKGFISDLWRTVRGSYSMTAAGLATSASKDLITTSFNLAIEALRSKRGDWMSQLQRDCRFSRTLPMPHDITDFYAANSSHGALDPDGIIFNGFGCNQMLTITEHDGDSVRKSKLPIIEMSCSLRQDSVGLARMQHHGMFEVQLDKLVVNPYLCDIPNDSLSMEQLADRVPFDFERRKNFNLSLTVEITSSWVNQAIIYNRNEKLGEFTINVSIPDSTYLIHDGGNRDGYFVYEREKANGGDFTPEEIVYNKKSQAQISLRGECFIVPRTFIGYDGNGDPIWGTGQYNVKMKLNESCDINLDYYKEQLSDNKKSRKGESAGGHQANAKTKEKWTNEWKKEWKHMKHRRRGSVPYANVWSSIRMRYGDNRWINILTDPVVNFATEYESKVVRENVNKWLQFGKETSK